MLYYLPNGAAITRRQVTPPVQAGGLALFTTTTEDSLHLQGVNKKVANAEWRRLNAERPAPPGSEHRSRRQRLCFREISQFSQSKLCQQEGGDPEKIPHSKQEMLPLNGVFVRLDNEKRRGHLTVLDMGNSIGPPAMPRRFDVIDHVRLIGVP